MRKLIIFGLLLSLLFSVKAFELEDNEIDSDSADDNHGPSKSAASAQNDKEQKSKYKIVCYYTVIFS